MFITNRSLPRRTVLRGLGVTLSLPFLDSMMPARALGAAALPPTRFVAIEMVHGAAGCAPSGRARNLWSPAQTGRDFAITPTLKPLERLRDYLTVISNTALHNAMSLVPDEDGPMADHARSSAVFLTAAHPRRTEGDDLSSGPSLDQLVAQTVGHETRLSSMQLCIEENGLTGGCGHGYSCAYTHTISWASPSQPLPMESSPRRIFERIVSSQTSAQDRPGSAGRSASVLDAVPAPVASLKRRMGAADRARISEYLEEVRSLEKRIQAVEERNAAVPRALADAPLSVPDSFDEHVDLMFDLQLLALKSDVTRVLSFKMGLDRSQRLYPESGVTTPFHALSHHREADDRIEEFARLNQYHVGKVARFLHRMRDSVDGGGNLLDHALVLYGSPMGDSHIHEHRFLPLFLAGKAGGAVRGNQHIACPVDTPMANVLLSVAQRLNVPIDCIGDSTGTVSL
ncbi:DUF1552 domain-containing protein [Acidobacteria bacterium AB60]|nr:DUF1552 domain-containing protein [Acidobacteria bacterium AB60]